MNNKTFAGIPAQYATTNAKVVLIPVPYDGTSTWMKGANKGFDAFLDAAENMELYDIETNSEVYKQGIYLVEPITEGSSPEAMVAKVYEETLQWIKKDKFITLFGGEHSISIGAIRAVRDSFKDITILQIDAHADLRKEYHGSTCNHACAVYEASQTTNLIQVGIRSMDIEEMDVMNLEKTYFAHQMHNNPTWMQEAIDQMTDNVYITFDLDAFDPSVMPSTGTPEPGGMLWYETITFLRKVFQSKQVVGFDLVELCPNEHNKAPNFLAAKLYYKLLSYNYFA